MIGRYPSVCLLLGLAIWAAAILLGLAPVERELAPGETVGLELEVGGATPGNLGFIKIGVELSGKFPPEGYGLWMEFYGREEDPEILFERSYGGVELFPPEYIPVVGEFSIDLDFLVRGSGTVGLVNLYPPRGIELFDYQGTLLLYNPNFSIEPNVWHRGTYHHYDNFVTIYINNRLACSAHLPQVTREQWVDNGFPLKSDGVLVDNLVVSRMIPPTFVAIFPAFENFRVAEGRWSVACDYTLRTGGTLADPNRELYIGRKQVERILANRKLSFTNLSPAGLTVDRLEVVVGYGGEEITSEWGGKFWIWGWLLVLGLAFLISCVVVFFVWALFGRRERAELEGWTW